MTRFLFLVLAALPLAAATDVSGKWTFSGDVAGNPIPLNCSFKQDAAAKIAGKCSVQGMEINVAGEVKETRVTFTFEAGGYTLTYTGRLEGDTLSGEIEVAGTTGTFSGKRDAS
jgi:hypothetical protein